MSTFPDRNISILSFLFLALQCSQPAAPANGGRDRESGVVGDVVTYHCNNGYNLRGDTTRTCGASGQWSGSVPTCECESWPPA